MVAAAIATKVGLTLSEGPGTTTGAGSALPCGTEIILLPEKGLPTHVVHPSVGDRVGTEECWGHWFLPGLGTGRLLNRLGLGWRDRWCDVLLGGSHEAHLSHHSFIVKGVVFEFYIWLLRMFPACPVVRSERVGEGEDEGIDIVEADHVEFGRELD